MSISYRVAKRFEQHREKLIAEFLTGLEGVSESEAAFQLSNEFGLNVNDARDLVEEYRELDGFKPVSQKDLIPLVSKYATACECGCGCKCYNKCECDCGC